MKAAWTMPGSKTGSRYAWARPMTVIMAKPRMAKLQSNMAER